MADNLKRVLTQRLVSHPTLHKLWLRIRPTLARLWHLDRFKLFLWIMKKSGTAARFAAAYEVALTKQADQTVEQRRMVRLLKLELKKPPRYRYGSYVPGREDWARRWDESPGRRILFYAYKDYSGSFFKWADSVNRYTDFAARMVIMLPHQYNYENDLVLPFPGIYADDGLAKIAAEADIVHIKDETGFFTGANHVPPTLLAKLKKPLIYTAYGGYMRKFEDDPGFRDHVTAFAARIAMTPDLNYDWFRGHFIPHSIDIDLFPYQWSDGLLLAHSPSTKGRKGTDDLQQALAGLPWNFDLIHGVSHTECIARKRHANVFFDQAGSEMKDKLGISTVIGWYGNSALEAAVFGIPTIAHLSAHAFAGARRAGRNIEQQCAIINTPQGAAGIRQTLTQLAELSGSDRHELSLRTRRWIEEFHSYQVCARELACVYKEVLAVGHSAPTAIA